MGCFLKGDGKAKVIQGRSGNLEQYDSADSRIGGLWT